MSRMAPCPTCNKTLAVTQYGKCVVCGQVITEAAPPTVPRGNGTARIAMALGGLVLLVGVGAAIASGQARFLAASFTGAGLLAAGWRFKDSAPL